MPRFFTKSQVAVLTAIFLAGCDGSEITTVKNATVPQDKTHTYDTALSDRASCDSEEWRTFKDDSNRTAVEYRCGLKGASELTAAMRVRRINETHKDFQNYYQSLDQRAEEFKNAPAQQATQAAQAQAKMADMEAQEAIENKRLAQQDPVAAMRRAAVRNETGSYASAKAMAERTQHDAYDAASNLEQRLASIQRDKERFQRDEQNALAGIEKSYGNVAKATEIFQWIVKEDEVFPSWAGVELEKKDGSKLNVDKNWQMLMRDLLHYRGEDHVHYALDIPGNVVPGQAEAASISEEDLNAMFQKEMKKPVDIQATSTARPELSSGEKCYDTKLKDFRSAMGTEAPVSNDMMNEWRSGCGLPPL